MPKKFYIYLCIVRSIPADYSILWYLISGLVFRFLRGDLNHPRKLQTVFSTYITLVYLMGKPSIRLSTPSNVVFSFSMEF